MVSTLANPIARLVSKSFLLFTTLPLIWIYIGTTRMVKVLI